MVQCKYLVTIYDSSDSDEDECHRRSLDVRLPKKPNAEIVTAITRYYFHGVKGYPDEQKTDENSGLWSAFDERMIRSFNSESQSELLWSLDLEQPPWPSDRELPSDLESNSASGPSPKLKTEEQIQQQNNDARVSMAQLRQEQSEDTRAERNEVIRLEQRQLHRFRVNRRRKNDQQRQQVHRAFISDSFLRLAFQYEPNIEYYAHSKVVIDAMDKECPHCHALKFKNEPAGMCCASGKVQLPEIEIPPEPY
ncbi:hypothetical protein QTP88_023691 [Uroleucon formosanum]